MVKELETYLLKVGFSCILPPNVKTSTVMEWWCQIETYQGFGNDRRNRKKSRSVYKIL